MKNTLLIFIALINMTAFSQQYSKSWMDINYAADTMAYHNMDPLACKSF